MTAQTPLVLQNAGSFVLPRDGVIIGVLQTDSNDGTDCELDLNGSPIVFSQGSGNAAPTYLHKVAVPLNIPVKKGMVLKCPFAASYIVYWNA